MTKQKLFHDALVGIFIGLILSIFFSLGNSEFYYPLSPFSQIGAFFMIHQIHPALVLLYSMACWALIGILFSFSSRIFEKNWSLLKMSLTHYGITLLGFFPIATLAGWFTIRGKDIIGLILIFTLIYILIWCTSYFIEYRKVKAINQQLKERQEKDSK
ncbi:DUF3021 domain-containing protein [Streptococcus pneumoniae]